MAVLSTGPISNPPVGGNRITRTVNIKIDNRDSVNSSTVQLQGYRLNGSRILYALETINVGPNQVITRTLTANFDAFNLFLLQAALPKPAHKYQFGAEMSPAS